MLNPISILELILKSKFKIIPKGVVKKVKTKAKINVKRILQIEDKVKQQVEDATEISKSSPIPDVKEIFTDVWADGGYKWHN